MGNVTVSPIYKKATVTIDHPNNGLMVSVVSVGVPGSPGPRGEKGDPGEKANVDEFELQDLTLIFDNKLI